MGDPTTPPQSPSPAGEPHAFADTVSTSYLPCSEDQQQLFAHDFRVGSRRTDTHVDVPQRVLPRPPDSDIELLQRGFDPNEINFNSVPDSLDKEVEVNEGLVNVEQSIRHLPVRYV